MNPIVLGIVFHIHPRYQALLAVLLAQLILFFLSVRCYMLAFLSLALLVVLLWPAAFDRCTPFVLAHSTSTLFAIWYLCPCRHSHSSSRYPLMCRVFLYPCWITKFLHQWPSIDPLLHIQRHLPLSSLVWLDTYACRRWCLQLRCHLFQSHSFVDLYSVPYKFRHSSLLLSVPHRFFVPRVAHEFPPNNI